VDGVSAKEIYKPLILNN